MSLIREWGKNMEFFFIVGDPDQAIFTWKGADPDVFITPPIPKERTRVLSQSYRVPRNIHGISQVWINKLSKRFPAEYKPRDYEGTIDAPSDLTFKEARKLVQYTERWIADGRTVMFLTACGYQLQPLIGVLREWGIPFHNPYRRKNGGWNPLYARKGTTTADRIKSFLAGQSGTGWTGSELRRWVHMLAVQDVLARGAKKRIEDLDDERMFEPAQLAQWFESTALRALLARDIAWLQKHMLAQYQGSSKYILKIVEHGGVKALDKEPNVITGTIHSVKGGEADVVVLDPSLSWSGIQKWNQGDKDSTIRQYYVGITRARESLVICRGAPNTEIRLPLQAPRTLIEEF
jgi:superfamily I DNA/RNA helicase